MVQNIPGVPGANGAAGANGANGLDATTSTTDVFTMPAELATINVQVVASGAFTIGQPVFVGQGAAVGTFEVTAKPTATSLTLLNLADTPNSLYLANSAPGTVFPVGSQISPSGWQGPAGASGATGAPAAGTYVTQTPVAGLIGSVPLSAIGATGLLHVTNVTGVLSVVGEGLAAGNVTPVDAGGPLVAGQVVQAVAGGLKTDTAANTRTLLGLGTIATQAASAVAITGGSLTGTSISTSSGSFTTLTVGTNWALGVSALQTLAAANLIAYAPKIRVVGNAGPVVMTSTPTLALGTVDGQECLMQGTHDTNTIEVQDNGSLAGSKLRLGAANRVLGAGDTLRLSWDATLAMWVETSYTNLV